jgi:hypothetical protein
VTANLNIHPIRHPLKVRFPDGKTVRSIGVTDVALPSINEALFIPCHIAALNDFGGLGFSSRRNRRERVTELAFINRRIQIV